MRRVIHISDLHFGRLDMNCIQPLVDACITINPDLVVISGDFTQRARIKEFKEAQEFLQKLHAADITTFVIPGNHDIEPFYNPILRVRNAYARYKKYISETIDPVYVDDEIAVASINTIRRSSIKDGRVREHELQKVETWLSDLPTSKVKIIVSHHPFDLPTVWRTGKLARKAKMAIHRLSKHTVDIYLSGHYHQSSVVHTALRYAIDNYSAIAVQAGTISNRQRGELQSFNVLTIEKPDVTVDTYIWNPADVSYKKISTKAFCKNYPV